MSRREGACGTGARHYNLDDLNPSVLAGRLASQYEPKFYPEDRCEKCIALGRYESEHCFTHHWSKKRASTNP